MHALLDNLFPHLRHRRLADFQCRGNRVIDPGRTSWALVSFEQDARMSETARRCRTGSNQLPQLGALGAGQPDRIFLMHRYSAPDVMQPRKS